MEDGAPSILAITADDRLYYQLLSASIDLGWKITWARTFGRAFELCCPRPMPLVVYDECLPGINWREALPGLSRFPDYPVVVLASSRVDEEVWSIVQRCRGYDVVSRTAGTGEWRRELAFAWMSRQTLLHPAPG